jgi:hypothetical protein
MTIQVKIIGFLSIFSLLGFYSIKNFKLFQHYWAENIFLALSLITIFILLGSFFNLVRRVERKIENKLNYFDKYALSTHVCLHFIPLAYFSLMSFFKLSLIYNIVFYPFILAFFYTGRKAWKVLFDEYKTKMYFFFIKGNIGLMMGSTFMLILGFVLNQKYGIKNFYNLEKFYFSIHFLLLTPSLWVLNRDYMRAYS